MYGQKSEGITIIALQKLQKMVHDIKKNESGIINKFKNTLFLMPQLICIEIPFGCDFLIQMCFFTWVIGNKSIKYF
uniref:Uncharacterized protein n=1 Tax=Catharus ustulatus TaxID=91951 RepID=A0A8C3Y7I6_CATUS